MGGLTVGDLKINEKQVKRLKSTDENKMLYALIFFVHC